MQSSLNSINSENSVQRCASPISDDIFYKENAYFFPFGYFVANLRIFGIFFTGLKSVTVFQNGQISGMLLTFPCALLLRQNCDNKGFIW